MRAKVTTSYLFAIALWYFFSLTIFALMQSADIVYIIDVGNSSIKVAQFEKNQIVDSLSCNFDALNKLNEFVQNPVAPCAISSVKSESDTAAILNQLDDVNRIQVDSNIPIKLKESLVTACKYILWILSGILSNSWW